MKVNKEFSVVDKLRKYHLSLLCKLLSKEELDKINTELISYDNNDSGVIRVIGCPYKSNVGGVVYILKSSKDNISDYKIINSIFLDDIGLVATSISLITHNKLSHKNILSLTSIKDNIIKVYLYSKFLNKNMNCRVLNISSKYKIDHNNKKYLKNILCLIDNNLIINCGKNLSRIFILKPTNILLLIKEDIGNGFFRHI